MFSVSVPFFNCKSSLLTFVHFVYIISKSLHDWKASSILKNVKNKLKNLIQTSQFKFSFRELNSWVDWWPTIIKNGRALSLTHPTFWGSLPSLPSTFKIFRPWKKSSTKKSWPTFCDQYFWKFPIWNSRADEKRFSSASKVVRLVFAQRFITIFNCRYHTSNHLSVCHKHTSLSPINCQSVKNSSTKKSWPTFCDQYFWKFPIWNSRADEKRREIRMVKVNVIFNDIQLLICLTQVGITSFFLFLHKACWILLFVSFSYRIRQCACSSTIRFVPCAFFINKQFHTNCSWNFS
jgi:hypothetical protein